jgi:peptide/nickel transport system substrate-binding protein
MNRKLLSSMLFGFMLLMVTSYSFIACTSDKDKKGNTAYIRIPGEPEKLNPLTTEDANAVQVMSNIFLSLLDFDAKTLELVPVLAKNRPAATPIDTGKYKGGIAYTYEIRDEATWDNGKPITAADYIFTIKAILNKKSGANNLRSGLDFIKDIVVDAQNPKKFTIVSDKKYILSETVTGTVPVLPEYVYDTEGSLKTVSVSELAAALKDTAQKASENLSKFADAFQSAKFSREKNGVVGSGAYALDGWIAGQSITLKKKANWWGDKLAAQNPLLEANPEQIVFKPVKDAAATVTMIQNNELDAASTLPAKDYNTMKKDEKLAALYEFAAVPALSLVHAGFNCKSPKLNDKRVRRAITHLFDVPTIIKTLVGGFGEVCPSPFLPQRAYFDKDLKPIALNIDQAKTLLTEAGWKDSNGDSTLDKTIGGKRTEMVIKYIFASSNDAAKNMGLMIQENGKKIGVKITLEPLEGKVMLENMKKRDFDMFVNAAGFAPSIDDPKEMWATSSNTPDGGNRFQFENKQADALIELIRSELDTQKRNVLYKQLQALIYDEQPAVFLFARQERIAVSKRFDAPIVARRPGFVVNSFKLKQ